MNKQSRFRPAITYPFLVLALAMVLVLVFAVTASAEPERAEEDLNECPWMDTSLTADERAWLLLEASTLEQKMRWLAEPPANQPDETFGGQYPLQVPCTPFIQFTDSPNAVTSRGVTGITAFPAQISLAATWDEDLSRLKGQAHGFESFYKMNNVLLGPGLASGRVPYLGRNSEYLGEDPLLGGMIAAAMIRGLQEDNPEAPVEAVVKHYVANEQELDRGSSSSNMDERTLRQIYTLPYEIAIKEGEPGGVMCAFNQVNGDWSCENELILQDILKGEDEIGFDGWVVSDFRSVHSTADSLVGGLDQELVSPSYYSPDNLYAALAAGEITEADIDESAFRVVSSHIEAGLFDHPLPPERVPDVSTPANQAVAQRVAEEGSVLLKNEDGILPFNSTIGTIAVIGPTASSTPTDGVSAETACGTSRPQADCSKIEAPLDSIIARAAMDGIGVVFDNGSDLGSAAATAASADVAIVFGYYTQGEGDDLENLSLMPQASTTLFAPAAAGDTNIKVFSVSDIKVGSTLVIDTGVSQESITVTAVGTAATDTALAFPAAAGDTNIKVLSVGGLVVGDMLSIDTGVNLETVMVTAVGTAGGTVLRDPAGIGDAQIFVESTAGFSVGDTITIDSGPNIETREITNISNRQRRIRFDDSLMYDHAAGIQVSGSGITFAPALSFVHAAGAAVRNPGTGITVSPALSQGHAEGVPVFSSYGDDLISTVVTANPNTIVILQTGGPVLMPWIDDVKGIFEVWYAGQEMGPAIAALLWGDVNPSGKLPQTFPVSEDDLPTAGSEAQYPGIVDENGIRQVDYTEGMQVGYRWYDAQGIEPLFPFGFGLSYTTFEYSHLQVTPVRVQSEKEIRVKFRVTNTGPVAGAEIAQVYLSLPDGLGEPPKRLVGWAKVTLEPGEHKNITVVIDPTSSAHPLSYWDMGTNSWVTAPGIYTVHVGTSSAADDLMSDSIQVWHRPGR